MPALDKTTLRAEVRAARDALSARHRAVASAQITPRIMRSDAWRNAKSVLLYLSFGSEFDTASLLINALADNKQLLLPRVDPTLRQLTIHRVRDVERETAIGSYNIREPRADVPRVEQTPDFVLVPGLAFTERGDRLGYGGGFYDKIIASWRDRPPLVAGAFALQIRDAIPSDAHDQRVDIVITETGFYCDC